jgi:hypothetical protein
MIDINPKKLEDVCMALWMITLYAGLFNFIGMINVKRIFWYILGACWAVVGVIYLLTP